MMVDVVMDASADADRDRAQSYVVFRLGGEGYALEVMRVQEVLDMQSLTEVPGGPKFLLGVINLRGHVVPVYDLRMPFGLAKDTKPDPGPLRADRRVERRAATSRSRDSWWTGSPTCWSSRPRKCKPPRSLDLGKPPPSSAA